MAYLQTDCKACAACRLKSRPKISKCASANLASTLLSLKSTCRKLGNSLGTTVNHYNNAHKELGKVDKDVVKIAGNDPSVESLAIDRPAIDKK